MKKNYKILISIGIVLVIATSGVFFQVYKTNKTISYNKQQEEIRIEQEKQKKNKNSKKQNN